jgi:hypothetical protein
MNSSYRGIFAHKLKDGTITDVQVEDTGGQSLSLPIAEYERRGIQPPADSLPDQYEYKPGQ